MEVRDQAVEHFEPKPRVNKEVGESAAFPDAAFPLGDGFQGAAARRPYRDDASPALLGAVDQIGRFLRQPVMLRVHFVLGNLVHADRAERSEADVQRDESDGNALVPDTLQQFLCKVEAGRRRGGGTHLAGIHRLIALLVLQLFLDVRRQGHLADSIEHRVKIAFVAEFYQPVSPFHDFKHLGFQKAAPEREMRARLCAPARAGQHLPHVVPLRGKKEEFHLCAGVILDPVNSGGQNPRIVQDQAVSGHKEVDDIIKMFMGDLPVFSVQNQKPGSVPRFDRCLCDQLFRQIVVEILFSQVGFHFFKSPNFLCKIYYN